MFSFSGMSCTQTTSDLGDVKKAPKEHSRGFKGKRILTNSADDKVKIKMSSTVTQRLNRKCTRIIYHCNGQLAFVL